MVANNVVYRALGHMDNAILIVLQGSGTIMMNHITMVPEH